METNSVMELSIRIVRSDKTVPFESKINIPIRPGQDHGQAMAGWIKMIEASLEIHKATKYEG